MRGRTDMDPLSLEVTEDRRVKGEKERDMS